jgi:small subunit ribosomal protein S16
VAVKIRMKKMGRTHRPFFRICAMDSRVPRDGRVIEELGTYDPMVRETDARAHLNGERIDYWLSVGAQPSDKVRVLINKYGTNGTHLDAQQTAIERMGGIKAETIAKAQKVAAEAAKEDAKNAEAAAKAKAEEEAKAAAEAEAAAQAATNEAAAETAAEPEAAADENAQEQTENKEE